MTCNYCDRPARYQHPDNQKYLCEFHRCFEGCALTPTEDPLAKLEKLAAKVNEATRDNPATFQSGAKRSAPKPEWWLLPRKALREVLRRFEIGKKYGIHNWKKAMESDDLDYVRQFDAHSQTHRDHFFDLVDKPAGAVDDKGDDLIANLAAHAWNAIALLEYALENETLVRKAFSQYPDGHSKRLVLEEPPCK